MYEFAVTPAVTNIRRRGVEISEVIANSLGAYLGSVAIAAGLGYISPVWIGIVLSMLGVSIAAFAFGSDRTRGRSTSRLRAAESILIDNRRASRSSSLCR